VRLDQRLVREHALSRRKARDYVETGRVDVDGVVCREPGKAVGDDSRVVLDVNRPAIGSVRTKLVVLREDPSLIIVEKPAGLLTLATEAREKDTLLSRVNAYLQHRYRRRPYVGVVHRLDKETSGAIVFARSREMLRALQELFRRHDIEREYVAIVEGSPGPDSGTIGLDLVRDAGDRRRGTARGGEEGRRAVTHWRVLRRMPSATLVALRLETGRTHQIRVHLAAIGHPVVGDAVYRPRHFEVPSIDAPRQMLHARTLGFRHPDTGERVLASSEIPEDFQERLGALAKAASPAVHGARGRDRSGRGGKPAPSTERTERRRGPLRHSRASVAQSPAEVAHAGIDHRGGSRKRSPGQKAHGAPPKGGASKENRFPTKKRVGPPGSPESPFRPGRESRGGARRRRRR
jgi:23S rRNA pseudouridine1911/1915/1917 synthase